MSIVVEDGTGNPLANSYTSEEFADGYLLLDPKKLDWDIVDPESKENLLILASESLDLQFNWYGTKTHIDSGLRFPRTGLVTRDGIAYPNDTVPVAIQKATAQLAYHINQNDPMPALLGAGISRLRVDVIDIRFEHGSTAHPFPPIVLALASEFGSLSKTRRVNQVYAV